MAFGGLGARCSLDAATDTRPHWNPAALFSATVASRDRAVRANAFREPGLLRQFKSFGTFALTQWSTQAPQRPIPWSHSRSRSRSLSLGRLRMHRDHLLRASRRTTRYRSQSPRRCCKQLMHGSFPVWHTHLVGTNVLLVSPSPDRGQRRLRSPELREAEHMQTSYSDYSVRRPRARSRQYKLFALIWAAP